MSDIAERLWRDNKAIRLAATAACILLILLSIAALIYHGIRRHQEIFFDFRVYYTVGTMWLEGINAYIPELYAAKFHEINGTDSVFGVFYPPQTLALFSFFTLWPMEQSHWVMFAANLILLAVAFVLLLMILRRHTSIGIFEITFLVLLICTSFGRTNLGNPQFGILIGVLLFGGFLLQQSNQPFLSGLAFAFVSLKPSFLPFYALYYFLRRNFKLVTALVAVSGLLTVLPVIATGRPLVQTITDWLMTLPMQNLPGAINSPDPASTLSVFMVNLEPLVYRVLGCQSAAGQIIFAIISLGLLVSAGWLILKSHPAPQVDLLDFSLVSVLSLLLVYHRNYDIFLLFPGLLYIYIYAMQQNQNKARFTWFVFLAVIVVILLAPNEIVVQFAGRNPALWDNYFFRLISTYLGWTNVVVLAALLWLKVQSNLTNTVRTPAVFTNQQADRIQ
jgi:hypothetical protein